MNQPLDSKNKSDAQNKADLAGSGDNAPSAEFFRYGQPDFYYSNDWVEQNELALPKNIFADKQNFTMFLNEKYGRYELTDYVLSTAKCIEEKTLRHFVNNVDRISIGTHAQNGSALDYHNVDLDGLDNCIASRFKETDIGLSEQEFSAFTKLHNAHINLDEEMKFIEQDQMKKQGYAFYSHLPANVCEQSMNPKQLTDASL